MRLNNLFYQNKIYMVTPVSKNTSVGMNEVSEHVKQKPSFIESHEALRYDYSSCC